MTAARGDFKISKLRNIDETIKNSQITMVKSQATRHFALPSRTANVSEAPLDKVEVVFITLIRVVGYADAGHRVRKVTIKLTKLKSSVVMSNPVLDRLHWLLKIDLLLVRSLKVNKVVP